MLRIIDRVICPWVSVGSKIASLKPTQTYFRHPTNGQAAYYAVSFDTTGLFESIKMTITKRQNTRTRNMSFCYVQSLRRITWAGLLFFVCMSSTYAGITESWRQTDETNQASIDHSAWQSILDRYLVTDDPSGVNLFRYSVVTDSDKKLLESYLKQAQNIDPRDYRRTEQMAYWINLYNALTIDLILDNYPVKTIKKLGGLLSFGPWDDDVARITGQTLTLNDIEHKILRPIWKDPRIHYAVNCASYGCPDLSDQAFTSDNIEKLLDRGAHDYINHSRGVRSQESDLIVSSIYDWYIEDFGGNDQTLLDHLMEYAEPDLKRQLARFKGPIDYEYDWRLNELR